MGNTEYDKRLREVAKGFKDLVDSNMEPFDNLVNRWPNAGSFNLGVWVERILDDRRNAIVAHVMDLKTTFAEMSSALYAIAERFDQVDEGNANEVKKVFDDSKKTSEDKVKAWNTERERIEMNHAGGERKPGDGYAQNVNIAFDPAGGEQKKV